MKKFIEKIYWVISVSNSFKGRGVKNFFGSFAKTPFNPFTRACKIESFQERG